MGTKFEVYRLERDVYVRVSQEPVWIAEINLAIGRAKGNYEGWNSSWLYWYDLESNRFPSPSERVQQAELRAEQAQQRAEQQRQLKEDLIAKLQARGIDPDAL